MYAEVIIDIAAAEVDRIFDYDCGGFDIKRGVRVSVPFGRTKAEGFVIGIKDVTDVPPEKIKKISSVLDKAPIITEEMFCLMEKMRSKMHLLRVDILRLFIPAAMRGGRVKELTRQLAVLSEEYRDRDPDEFIRKTAIAQRELYDYLSIDKPDGEYVSELNKIMSASALRNFAERGIVRIADTEKRRVPYADMPADEDDVRHILTDEQQKAYDAITSSGGETFLLHGVTGSGKTEVYMRCIRDALDRGKTAIMLVPEISLTPQMLRNFRNRFGDDVAVLHSALGQGEKFDEWRKCLTGEAKVVLGARSAIFAPLKNIGVIIIDEEHDQSYVSERNPRYVTHKIAEWRREYNGAALILGSATPSMETYYAAKQGRMRLLELNGRVNKRPLPEIKVVNMCREALRGNRSIFSDTLTSELKNCLDGGNQAMLFLNRRGYASYVMCKICGYVAKCERCDVSLVYHKEEDRLKCHYCGNMYAPLTECPECGSKFIKEGYIGTEKVADKLTEMFPSAGVLRMDNDSTRTKGAHARILGEFGAKKADILVGTQMIAKGHDFPDVTLVGILDADMSLHVADYRSVERTFQLTTQVAGRAGRASLPGKVILQTHTPNHYVYNYVRTGDYKGFYEKEINLREVTKYPPFAKIVRVLVSGTDDGKAAAVLKNIYERVSELKSAQPDKFIYLAYMRAPLKKIMDEYRMQILARLVPDSEDIEDAIYTAVDECRVSGITSYAETDPIKLS
ncbi:MAG TPA: primosomal protein N' [Candidatus Protoclostridium stercorigallinarum]|uniref:Replication restart protein PriA n=1 Tax=Candidatus Protoclostridium stercorigallinarum TaxID=2838741 RepID=A0A9D1Q002_9FIRM|nr:primosomal protein N' [Candidatus Protoclostridium stercorigallinarum]